MQTGSILSRVNIRGQGAEPVTLWHCPKVCLTAGLLRVSLTSPACLEVYKQHSLAELASALDNFTSSPNQTPSFYFAQFRTCSKPVLN